MGFLKSLGEVASSSLKSYAKNYRKEVGRLEDLKDKYENMSDNELLRVMSNKTGNEKALAGIVLKDRGVIKIDSNGKPYIDR